MLVLIAKGRSNAEIAAQLVISAATVKTHINNLFGKAGLHDRAQAVSYAFTRGLCAPRAEPSRSGLTADRTTDVDRAAPQG